MNENNLSHISFFIIISAPRNKIAVTTKVKGLVEIMPVGKDSFSNLKPGTILADGDKTEQVPQVLPRLYLSMISPL